jgi:hypothetical protein
MKKLIAGLVLSASLLPIPAHADEVPYVDCSSEIAPFQDSMFHWMNLANDYKTQLDARTAERDQFLMENNRLRYQRALLQAKVRDLRLKLWLSREER